ncbi:hypothetical protein CK203_091975 [Vitis vinifera]|uniref:Retrovirus-related Pol polyprotein from transposon TNT 1-94 n=1 Tax=Vitis vinifera TaxID=29760 RepID=A0A438DF35_VITVI|nr:hypothetical protein CK203_091975 [Vitis vinifera]
MDVSANRMVSLNGSNYAMRKDKMEDLLYVKGYHHLMFAQGKLVDKTNKEWTLLHRQDFCISYTPDDFGVVGMGNNGVAKVVGIASLDLKMDVKIVFLYGDLEKEIYME